MGSQIDIAVIGGGILGVILARLAAERGWRTVLFRMSDARTPNADTLRNQSWLQSGLRYIRIDKVLATKMWVHGRRMHEFFAMKPPEGHGVIQVGSDEEAAAIYEDAEELGVRSQIRELAPEAARLLLGPLHCKSGVAFETPECPFEEALLLNEARETARAAGAELREVSEPVELLPIPQLNPSHRLRVDGREIEAGVTVLAAGAGNVPLLKSLSRTMRLELRQTPLLVVPGEPLIQCPILLDRSAGLSVVAHRPGTCRSDGCMVIGTDVLEESVEYCLPAMRRVGAPIREDFCRKLPSCIRERLAQARFTAGQEPIPYKDGVRLQAIGPWIETVDGHPDVIVALPGRATLALHAAESVVEKISSDAPKAKTHDSCTLPGEDWSNRIKIHMHYEEQYDGMNDSCE
ncbi:MAG TPA: FAD-binding oxidoreductase [Candidatus Angelobacter sp.]